MSSLRVYLSVYAVCSCQSIPLQAFSSVSCGKLGCHTCVDRKGPKTITVSLYSGNPYIYLFDRLQPGVSSNAFH